MKLSSDETRAIAFVLGLIGLATLARLMTRPRGADVPAAAQIDAGALEDSSELALAAGRARAKPLGDDEVIDVNTASVEQLDRLPGVGRGLAARIVQEREQNGAYDSAADLRTVHGIGPALLTKLAPHLSFGFVPGLARRIGSRSVGESEDNTGPHPGTPGSSRQRADRARLAGPINLNSASAAELDALPGIGPALAARIVAKRDSLNGFETIDDLKKVRGIGPATLERLRPFLRT